MTTIGRNTSRPFPSWCNTERVAYKQYLEGIYIVNKLVICARDLPIVAEMPVVALNIADVVNGPQVSVMT